ncbi:MAG: hypothetical protein QM212_08950, partial [Bacteroidota bacterium]|nr:hypothetical protein [Bacteroidota bacterium]
LDLEIHTTSAVLFELYSEQQEVLKAYQSVGKLEVHNLQEKDFIEIYNENYPNLYPKQINLFYMLPIKLMLVC